MTSKRIYRAQTGKHGLRRDRSTADTPGFPGAVDFHQRRRLANRKRSASTNRGGQAARLHTACGTALPRSPSRLQLPRSGRPETRKIYQRLQYTWREKATLRSAFERQRKGDPAVLKRDPGVQKEDPPFPHSTLNPVISPCDDRESGAGGPRGPEGLGPPPEKPARPYADMEATILTVLADRARLFAGARVTEADEQSILIGYLTDHHASELRPFADDIQAATGAEQVRFTVALGPGLKRRLQ